MTKTLRATLASFMAGSIAVLVLVAASRNEAQLPDAQETRVARSQAAATRVPGFLQPAERPDALSLLPAPPLPGSGAYAADEEIYRSTRELRDTPRWRFAASDSNLGFPQAAGIFECALGVRISEATTPNLYVLLRRTVIDAGQSTYPVKQKYGRTRPFVDHGDTTCVPEDEETLRTNASYPSGHASLGWTWAMILAEMAPARADALFVRGLQFGQSRVICGVHRQSDVDAGRLVAAAVVARLHGNAEFTAQLAQAKEEVARAAARGDRPTRDCDAEARTLAAVPTR
jgi:acid phosphatase (class A)